MTRATAALSHTDTLRNDILKAGYSILNSTDRSPANAEFHSARYALYSLAAANSDPESVSRLAQDMEIRMLGRKIFPISCEAGVTEECALAEKMLNDPALDFDKLYAGYYGETYEALMQAETDYLVGKLNIDLSMQRIAYIGGGAMPLPALLMARRYGCRVTIVDPHADSCAFASRLVERLNLSHLIDVVALGGQDFDYRGYDMAWMANWIDKKQPIFMKMKCCKDLRYVVARSAVEQSLSFIINDTVNPCNLCASEFKLVHKTTCPGLSLNSLIFENGPCAKASYCLHAAN